MASWFTQSVSFLLQALWRPAPTTDYSFSFFFSHFASCSCLGHNPGWDFFYHLFGATSASGVPRAHVAYPAKMTACSWAVLGVWFYCGTSPVLHLTDLPVRSFHQRTVVSLQRGCDGLLVQTHALFFMMPFDATELTDVFFFFPVRAGRATGVQSNRFKIMFYLDVELSVL